MLKNSLITKTALMTGVFLFAVSCNFVSYAEDSFQFRGPERDGVYPATGLLRQWPEGGPELLFMVSGLNEGYSSPAILGDRFYITGMHRDVEYMYAFDIEGELLWKKEYGAAARSYPGTRATPTVMPEAVYISSGAGEVVCFDPETGEIKWYVDAYREFNGRHGRWGFSESVLVVDGKVIFTPGGNTTTMVALDALTGETVWTSESVGGGAAYVSPILVEIGEKKLIVTLTDTYMLGVRAENGAIEWQVPYPRKTVGRSGINAPSPVYHDGRIFFTSGYDHTGLMLELSDDASRASVAWTNDDLDNHHGGVVLVDGYIYGANWLNNQMGNWVCLDWETGKTMYEESWHTKGSIVAAEGLLYCYEERTGHIGLVNATPEKFDLISSFRFAEGDGPHWAHPVISGGRLYIRHGDVLAVYDIEAE